MAAAALAHPIVIGHRGASGERPEHTLASYERAIEDGADFIEPDLVMTKDHVLVARHENEISGTTDVAAHPEFAVRKATRTIDGQHVTGWFTEDFTLAELKTLRARERLPQLRPANAAYDGQFEVPTFEEILALREKHPTVGVYPEIKHGTYFTGIGMAMERPLLAILAKHHLTRASDPVFIQSFEVGNLVWLKAHTKIRLVQLIDDKGTPADLPSETYAAMLTPAGLAATARRADAIGINKSLVSTDLVSAAHAAGLKVHAWTYRAENFFLPAADRTGDDPKAHGDLTAELRAAYATGLDGVFSDFPGIAVKARIK
ncbi:Glycerophosphoryl diester phosphodiesterase [Sphingomonas antarctica]